MKKIAWCFVIAGICLLGYGIGHLVMERIKPPKVVDSQPTSVKDLDRLKQLLIHYEGERLTVYLGPNGHPTVGIGHEVVPGDNLEIGDRIQPHHAQALFIKDVKRAGIVAFAFVSNFHELNTARQHVIIAMMFQIGESGVAGFHHFHDAVELQRWNRASLEMLYADISTKRPSLWHLQTPLRCEDMAEQMRTGRPFRNE